MKALFLHDPNDLDADIPGGVQLCSREFLAIVRAAADSVELTAVNVTRHPWWRLRRKLGMGSYLHYRPREAVATLRALAETGAPTHVFLNRTELLRLAPLVRAIFPGARLVIMSHGNQTGDDLYEVAGPHGRRRSGLSRIRSTLQLGFDLTLESRYRHRYVDAVCVMSEEEGMLERWLGARRTVWLPRIVTPAPLAGMPVAGRVGFVGTLDHTPNLVGLREICSRLSDRSRSGIELRIVGGPEQTGRRLAQEYPNVKYAGRLNQAELLTEARSWSLFLNPVFWLSRGASMKLGQALGWGLPILTTRSGARGYRLPAGLVEITSDSPDEFTSRFVALLEDRTRLGELRDRLAAHGDAWEGEKERGRELRLALE